MPSTAPARTEAPMRGEERMTAHEIAILRRMAAGKPGREDLGTGFALWLSGLTEIDEKGVMRITAKGRRALEEADHGR